MKFAMIHKAHRSSANPDRPAQAAPTTLPAKVPASLPALVASVFTRTHVALRARMLRRLLIPVGPLALTVIAGGAFAKYVEHARWSRLAVSLEDAARVTPGQVFDLVRYVEQSDPLVLQQVMVVVSRDATTMAALGVLGASVSALVLDRWSRRKAMR
jgi:hypothetical protein